MNDLRCKLTPEDKEEIRKLWSLGYMNYSLLATRFKVHPKTIRKVIDDNYRLACNEFNRINWYRYKPTKEHHTELMRKYRKRKKDLKTS